MLNYKIRIGLAPCRRWLHGKRTGIFSQEFAKKVKDELVPYIKAKFGSDDVDFVDLEFLNEEGLMFLPEQADAIIDEFQKQKVDGLFIINCNFGCEEVAAKVAQGLNLPTLIWAPKDTVFREDGMRYTDSQCGLFAISKQLQRLNIPFSHIENCEKEEPAFIRGVEKFLSVTCMVKGFRRLRIAQIGCRPKPFNSVIFNEGELLEKFGVEVAPINLAIVKQEYDALLESRSTDLDADVQLLKSRFADFDGLSDEDLKRSMVFKYLFPKLAADYGCQVVSTECWTAMNQLVGAMPCIAMSVLADERFIVTCESDVMGAISMALLSLASRGKSIPFFGEFTVRHPENPNAELLWHCGPFAYSLKHPDSKAVVFNQKPGYRLKDGHYTITRLDGMHGVYNLLCGGFDAVDGPHTFGTHIWAQFDDYRKWEQKLIYGPYIHHMAEIEGDYTEELEEFCRYIPNLTADRE